MYNYLIKYSIYRNLFVNREDVSILQGAKFVRENKSFWKEKFIYNSFFSNTGSPDGLH